MKFTKENMLLENGINKEWIITNGIGGYASSTILGINTRKYHGLLIAPLNPPARRYLVLSKLDEAVQINNKEIPLYSNMCKSCISEGYKRLTEFEKELIPKYTYEVDGVIIEKSICMKYLENTVCVLYKIKTSEHDVKFKFAPILNFRDFHTMSTSCDFSIKQQIKNRKVKLIINDNNTTPVYMNVSDGEYIEHCGDVFRNMYYMEEEKRGFFPEENHVVSGRYEVNIAKNTEKEISFICSLEENIDELNVNNVINNEINRLENIVENETEDYMKQLMVSADSFIVYRPTFGLHTVIAGYPWFLDWGRDTLISFEGLFLVRKEFELAKEIIATIIRDIKFGLVPNGYSGFDNRPLYNSVDSSLLLFEQIKKYLEYTNDYKFIEEKVYSSLVNIINSYVSGIDVDDNNIYLDKDGLLVSGTDKTQNTWMDAKIGEFVVTPRNGKAVEINALWYNALKILSELSTKFNDESTEKYCNKLATKCRKSFNAKFYNEEKKSLYDVLGDSKIRPNQLFALSLTYQVLDIKSDIAKEVFSTVKKELLKKHGLKTLAKGEKNYIEIYEGDNFKRDMSYHQGVTWVWLLGLYYNSLKNFIKVEKDKTVKLELEKELSEFIETTRKTFKKSILTEGCVGSISELYDSKTPYLPKGSISQAWSVAEVIRILKDA